MVPGGPASARRWWLQEPWRAPSLRTDRIEWIEIDGDGRLAVRLASIELPQIYLEAMGVHWQDNALCSTVPDKWDYGRWLRQILDAAHAQGVQLIVDANTRWINVSDDDRELMRRAASNGEKANE